MIFKNYLTEWLTTTKENVKYRTFITYESMVRKHIDRVLGSYEVAKLNEGVIKEFFESLSENGNKKTGLGLSSGSIKLVERLLKLIFEALQKQISSNRNPTIKNKDFSGIIERAKKKMSKAFIEMDKVHDMDAIFDKEAQSRIVNYCQTRGRRQDIGILIALYTGLRLGEVLALQWSDIDFEKGLMKIHSSAYYGKANNSTTYSFIDGTPKSRSSYRTVALPNGLLELLIDLKNTSLSKYIVARLDGKRIPTHSYQYSFKQILKKCDITYGSFHTLRHTFATRAIELGTDIKTVSDALGHQNPAFTLNRYVHSTLDSKKSLANKIMDTTTIAQ